MKNRKKILRHIISLILFNLGILVFYLFFNKYRSISETIALVMDIVMLISMILFDIYSLITIVFTRKYSEEKVESLHKKWYMKGMLIILKLFVGLEIILALIC